MVQIASEGALEGWREVLFNSLRVWINTAYMDALSHVQFSQPVPLVQFPRAWASLAIVWLE